MGGWLGWFRRDTPAMQGTRRWIGPKRGSHAPQEPAKPVPSQDLSRYSLWEGLLVPMQLPPDKVSGAVYAEASRDIGAPAPQATNPKLFVGVEMDLEHPEQYRDAVAQVSRVAGFSSDARFPPAFADAENKKIQLWGWLPRSGLPEMLKVPSLARLELQERSMSTSYLGPQLSIVELLVALRVSGAAKPEDVIPAALARLSRASGFVLKKTIGVQEIPKSGDRALIVSGEVVVRNIGRILADPQVVKVMAVPPGQGDPISLSAQAPTASVPRRFLSFVFDRHLALFVALGLLIVPWTCKALLSFLRRS